METVHSRRALALAPASQAAMAPSGGLQALAPPGGVPALRADVAGAQAAGR